MGKFLIVSPAFPPDKTVASQRMASLVRFLISSGEKVVVLTNVKEEGKVQESRDLKYYFVETDNKKGGFLVFQRNARIYDEAFKKCTETQDFSCTLVTMGPFYTYGIPSLAKKKGLACIVDFRDPWVFDYRDAGSFFKIRNMLGLILKVPMERLCVGAATAVTTVSPGWVKLFRMFYPLKREKFLLIENGYDEDILLSIHREFSNTNVVVKERRNIEIVVFGKLFYYTMKYSKVFVEALSELSEEVALNVKQIGEREDVTDELLNMFGLPRDIIKSTGFLNYSDGVVQLESADVFLIIESRKWAIGTKIYDYIFMGKPVMYVGPKNTTLAQMVEELPNGIVCSAVEEIVEALRHVDQYGKRNNTQRKDFSRKTQNEKFYTLLRECSRL